MGKKHDKYSGISEKVLKDGTKHIMVRFKYNKKTYPIKNFTKLYGCTTKKSALDKLNQIKVLIAEGKDPFIKTENNLNAIFDERLEYKVKNGDWTHSTPKNYSYFYNKYIRETIGNKRIEQITYQDLLKVQKSMTDVQNSTKNTLKLVLNPIFEEQRKLKNIKENPMDDLEVFNIPIREKLSNRTDENTLELVRKLYKAIPSYKAKSKQQETEIKMFLYLSLLTAHRYGELLRLTKEDCYIDKKMIISPKTITKTKEDYKFPIPNECLEYLESVENGLIFPSLKRGGIYQIFQRLVKLAKIDLYKNKRISLHDTRRFLLAVMIRDCKIDSIIADTCLEHKQQTVIKHYVSVEYSDKVEAFNKYWDKIREIQK